MRHLEHFTWQHAYIDCRCAFNAMINEGNSTTDRTCVPKDITTQNTTPKVKGTTTLLPSIDSGMLNIQTFVLNTNGYMCMNILYYYSYDNNELEFLQKAGSIYTIAHELKMYHGKMLSSLSAVEIW